MIQWVMGIQWKILFLAYLVIKQERFGAIGMHINPYYIIISPIGSMVLVYMLTKRGYIDGIHVTMYSSAVRIRHGF